MKGKNYKSILRLIGTAIMATGLLVVLLLSFSLDVAAVTLSPPQRVDVFPPANSHDAEVTTPISITYDQDMDPATVNPQTFAVHARQTGWLMDAVDVDGGTITLQPSSTLHAGELVQVSATTATLSLAGEAPLLPTIWEFTTALWSGNADFHEHQILNNSFSRNAQLGDFDHDGDLDAIGVSCYGFTRIYYNDGKGNFTLVQSFDQSSYCIMDVDLGDLDGDGDLDAFLSNYTPPFNFILTNDDGLFTLEEAFPSHHDCYSGLGDLDGDGDLDLFIASGGYTQDTIRVWKNDGNGNFTLAGNFDSPYEHMGVALGDLDGDYDLDAFTAGWYNTYNKVWLNDGNGTFTETQVITNTNTIFPLLGDLDGDGTLDVYLSNTILSSNYPDEVWLNDGTGHFTDSGQRLDTVGSNIPALGDLDNDGDLDVYHSGAHITAAPDEVWSNDGAGTFTLFRTVDENNPGGGAYLGDLDNNGSLDAFTGSSEYSGYGFQVYLNSTYKPELDPESLELSGMYGEIITYTLTVTNAGNITDTIILTYTGNTWEVVIPVTSFDLEVGESEEFLVMVSIPEDVQLGDIDTLILTAVSASDPAASDSSTLTTMAYWQRMLMPLAMKN